jgi:putative ABC transport system ATP-binding protein
MNGLAAQNAVSCRHIERAFLTGAGVPVQVLRGVDLDVQKGEIFFLAGPSGCGKTTLISIIAGLLAADAGECSVFGNTLSAMSDLEKTDFRSHHTGMLFQSYHLLPMLTVLDNVAVPLLIQGMPKEQAWERARASLAAVGLEDRAEEKPRKLSGGQQQRVAIARALVHQPELLLCDEPTAALDHENGMMIMELLKKLNRDTGVTLVIVTHDNRIFPFAHRIATMDDGRIESIAVPRQAQEAAHA